MEQSDEVNALRLLAVSTPGQPRSSLIMPGFGADFSLDAAISAFDEHPPAERRAMAMLSAIAVALRKPPTPIVAAGVGALALLLLGVGTVSHLRSQTQLTAPSEMLASAQPLVTDSLTRLPRSANGALDPATDISGGSSSASISPKVRASSEGAPSSRATAAKEPAPEPASPPTPSVQLPNVGDLSRAVPGTMTARLDSVMRAVGSSPSKPAITARDWMPRPGADNTDTGVAIVPARVIGSLPRAPYPEALRAKHVEGRVLVEFYVDTNGHPDMGTLAILESDHELFTEAVRKVIPYTRFIPGEENGQKVRARVRVPFAFALTRE
jgi:TonB family protein